MKLNDSLKWRYATKKFDPNKKVSQENIDYIKESIQLAASSFGLQLYKVLIIEDNEIREKLKPASWNQSQVTDCSHLIVFCTYTDISPEYVDNYLKGKAETQGLEYEQIKPYGDYMKGFLEKMPQSEIKHWTAKQTYIALGNALAACGELQVDGCPLEGFEPDKYDEILGLKEKGLRSVVAHAVGYRHEEDTNQHLKKHRIKDSDLFISI